MNKTYYAEVKPFAAWELHVVRDFKSLLRVTRLAASYAEDWQGWKVLEKNNELYLTHNSIQDRCRKARAYKGIRKAML